MTTSPVYSGVPPVLKVLAHDVRWSLLMALTRSDRRVQELIDIVQQPANLVSYHLKQLRAQHLVIEHRSSADARDMYYTANLARLHNLFARVGATLHPAFALDESSVAALPASILQNLPRARVLFLCTANSARSQLAEGLLRHMTGGHLDVSSAGSAPTEVHPCAVRLLKELGVSYGKQRATHVDALRDQRFDYIITLCDQMREVCPVFPGQPDVIHWSIPDPVRVRASDEEQMTAFRRVADELTWRLRYLLHTIVSEQGLVPEQAAGVGS